MFDHDRFIDGIHPCYSDQKQKSISTHGARFCQLMGHTACDVTTSPHWFSFFENDSQCPTLIGPGYEGSDTNGILKVQLFGGERDWTCPCSGTQCDAWDGGAFLSSLFNQQRVVELGITPCMPDPQQIQSRKINDCVRAGVWQGLHRFFVSIWRASIWLCEVFCQDICKGLSTMEENGVPRQDRASGFLLAVRW